MKRSALRMEGVDTPIIPTIAALVRDNPGTISLGQGVVNYGPPAQAISALPGLMGFLSSIGTRAMRGRLPSSPMRTACLLLP